MYTVYSIINNFMSTKYICELQRLKSVLLLIGNVPIFVDNIMLDYYFVGKILN